MTEIEAHLGAERVAIDVPAASREDVLEELSRLLGGNDTAAREAVHDGLVDREQISTTGTGGGIAFPHARAELLPGLRLAVLRTANRVEFGAMDGKPVDLFIALAGPVHMRREYLSLLGKLSYLLRTEAIRSRLRAAAAPEEVVRILAETEVSAPDSRRKPSKP